MGLFKSLLVPLDGSRAAARGLGCATWLAENSRAKLHILSATAHARPAREELIRLQVPEAYWHLVILHQVPRIAEDAILGTVAENNVDLIIMSTHGETAERTLPGNAHQQAPGASAIGHVTRAVVEQCTVPVLLLPPAYNEALPWKRVLVPMSGETQADAVLMTAISLANALALEVHVLHVIDRSARDQGLAHVAHYSDAIHHEYPQRLSDLVHHALPNCAPKDCRCIKDVALSCGDVAAGLLEHIQKKDIGLLIVGWHGQLMRGRAEIIKKLLPALTCPILLVKRADRASSRLLVGQKIAACSRTSAPIRTGSELERAPGVTT